MMPIHMLVGSRWPAPESFDGAGSPLTVAACCGRRWLARADAGVRRGHDSFLRPRVRISNRPDCLGEALSFIHFFCAAAWFRSWLTAREHIAHPNESNRTTTVTQNTISSNLCLPHASREDIFLVRMASVLFCCLLVSFSFDASSVPSPAVHFVFPRL